MNVSKFFVSYVITGPQPVNYAFVKDTLEDAEKRIFELLDAGKAKNIIMHEASGGTQYEKAAPPMSKTPVCY